MVSDVRALRDSVERVAAGVGNEVSEDWRNGWNSAMAQVLALLCEQE